MLYQITAPANNERGPRYIEKALAAIHQAHPSQPVSLLYGVREGQIGLFVRCDEADRDAVIEPIVAGYPEASVTLVEEWGTPQRAADVSLSSPITVNGQQDAGHSNTTRNVWSTEVRLHPELFPILRHSQFEDMLNHNFADPVSGLLRAIRTDSDLECRVEITVSPASHRRCHSAQWAVHLLERDFFRRHHWLARHFAGRITWSGWWSPVWWLALVVGIRARWSSKPDHTALETSTSRVHEREEDLQAAADKLGGHLFETRVRLIVEATPGREREARERLRQMAGALGAFTRSRLATFVAGSVHRGQLRHPARSAFLLSHEELATLWHPPTSTSQAERMHSTEFRELEAPLKFHSEEEGAVALGRVRFRDDQRIVTLGIEDRRRHLYIVGKTGMGKTTLLQSMLATDIRAGRGVCLVDPHGDLADNVTSMIPKHRTNDVILFDAANRDQIIGFNPLACRDPTRIDQVTSGVVSAIRKLYESWGPRLEDTLRNAVFATIERGGNLLSVMQLLGEKTFRERTVPLIRDPIVRSFWIHEFASWSDNYRTEAVAAIQNKLRPFLTSTTIRAIVSQPGRSLDLREVMDKGQVLIVNLSKGRLGEDNSTLLGALLVTSIQQAAMTRADIPEADRRDFSLYVDEFQNFTTGSFASVLSEARKYRLSLIVAHQYLSQLDDQTANAVFGNVGSIIAFQIGTDDAERLAQQMSKHPNQLTPENLTGLPKYTAYSRLLIDGMPSSPFSMMTLPVKSNESDPERGEIIRKVMNRRFGLGVGEPQPTTELATSTTVAL